jgi:hypothetical protein
LDLRAVAELFKDSKNLEEFERNLNDPDRGINNLDLDENNQVDFLRVLEDVSGDAHVIVLQAQLGRDEYQDVATIEVEKSGSSDYVVQVHGDDSIYGSDYYVTPSVVRIQTWPIIGWMYRPAYRPYRSAFYFGAYPGWWRPFRPVSLSAYHTRTVRYTSRTTFSVTRTRTVNGVARVNYKPHSSTLVRKKTTVTHSRTTVRGGGTTRTKTQTTRTRTTKRKN